jgi:flavin-binding protein dodecin
MAKVVKGIELMSQSPKSWEDAAQDAVSAATETLRLNITWELPQCRGDHWDAKVPPTLLFLRSQQRE